jgi:hypothetical protein
MNMSDEEKKWNKKNKPTYVMLSRNLMRAWVASFVCMVILTGLSLEWANYVDYRSNHRWCGIIGLFNEAYKETPPRPGLGQKIADGMLELHREFKCK